MLFQITCGNMQNTRRLTFANGLISFIRCSIYIIQVVQQPQRARMCGFGDKDRRLITPPPIIKLTVTTNEGYPIQVR
jgi:hypothetical protein